jgi:TRAP-type C4-dicarboxylate transport system permease large subunit
VLVPIAKTYGIDLVHLGIIVSINAMIGLNTPPVGLALYVVAGIANVPMFQVFRKVLFLLIPLLIGLVIITYYEPITLWFPRIIFK